MNPLGRIKDQSILLAARQQEKQLMHNWVETSLCQKEEDRNKDKNICSPREKTL